MTLQLPTVIVTGALSGTKLGERDKINATVIVMNDPPLAENEEAIC